MSVAISALNLCSRGARAPLNPLLNQEAKQRRWRRLIRDKRLIGASALCGGSYCTLDQHENKQPPDAQEDGPLGRRAGGGGGGGHPAAAAGHACAYSSFSSYRCPPRRLGALLFPLSSAYPGQRSGATGESVIQAVVRAPGYIGYTERGERERVEGTVLSVLAGPRRARFHHA